MTADGKTNLDKARAAWGAAAPEWVIALAEACDAATQSAVASRLGYTPPVINSTLANSYAGRMDKLEQRVRGELMGHTVNCPVLGEITRRKCIDSQSRAYSNTNALRVELRRACKVCPNAIGKEKAA